MMGRSMRTSHPTGVMLCLCLMLAAAAVHSSHGMQLQGSATPADGHQVETKKDSPAQEEQHQSKPVKNLSGGYKVMSYDAQHDHLNVIDDQRPSANLHHLSKHPYYEKRSHMLGHRGEHWSKEDKLRVKHLHAAMMRKQIENEERQQRLHLAHGSNTSPDNSKYGDIRKKDLSENGSLQQQKHWKLLDGSADQEAAGEDILGGHPGNHQYPHHHHHHGRKHSRDQQHPHLHHRSGHFRLHGVDNKQSNKHHGKVLPNDPELDRQWKDSHLQHLGDLKSASRNEHYVDNPAVDHKFVHPADMHHPEISKTLDKKDLRRKHQEDQQRKKAAGNPDPFDKRFHKKDKYAKKYRKQLYEKDGKPQQQHAETNKRHYF